MPQNAAFARVYASHVDRVLSLPTADHAQVDKGLPQAFANQSDASLQGVCSWGDGGREEL